MKKNIKKKIWFIRHGESQANADENFKSNSFGGQSISISEKGKKQAEELLKHFSDAPDLVITSPYVRTKETAKPLTDKHPNISHEEWPIHEFTYLSNKRCQNTSFLEREPWKDEYWQKSNPEHCDGDGAESFIDFMERVRETIEKIKKRKENFIVLFSHNYTIVAIRYILEKNPKKITPEVMRDFKKYFKENPIPNATKVEFDFGEICDASEKEFRIDSPRLSKYTKQLGKIGGKKSVQAMLKGKAKEEISEMMHDVRMKRIAQTLKESILEDPA